MTTTDALALADQLDAQEVLTMPGQPFTLAAVRPWLARNDALRAKAAAALRDLAGAQERAEKAEARVRELEALGTVRALEIVLARCKMDRKTADVLRYQLDVKRAALGEGGIE